MSLLEKNLADFTAVLASSAPTPGGGGASALVGALAAALGNMVSALTIGKKKYEANEFALRELSEKATELQQELLRCIDGDAEAFAPLAEAYSLPKDAPNREAIMEQCLRRAAAAPMHVCELCCKVIALQEQFAVLGSRLMLSDAATGAALARGALEGASFNVFVNTRSMADRAYAEAENHVLQGMLEEYCKRADTLCARIRQELGGNL